MSARQTWVLATAVVLAALTLGAFLGPRTAAGGLYPVPRFESRPLSSTRTYGSPGPGSFLIPTGPPEGKSPTGPRPAAQRPASMT
jgi:hypothetical protein